MKKNVKLIASLVRKAKRKLQQDKRNEALEIMKKAVNVDDNNGVLVQVIKVIGKKKPTTEPENEPVETPVEVPEATREEIPMIELDELEPVEAPAKVPDAIWEEIPIIEQDELEPVEIPAEVPEAAWDDIPMIELDELEPLETTEEVPVVEQALEEPEPEVKAVEINKEEITSMASEDKLTELFEASDREYDIGNQQRAISYLKKAKKLDPDNSETLLRMNILKTKIKSANLVQIARKKLESGDAARAVVLARQAFNMRPDSANLDELLSDLENYSGTSSSIPEDSYSEDDDSIPSGEYITVIRELVQDNSLEEAASVAKKAFELFPDDVLVLEFVDNFKKLGLME